MPTPVEIGDGDPDDDDDACCVCGGPAVRDYDDREDCPSCGRVACEVWMQAAMDYHDERGNG